MEFKVLTEEEDKSLFKFNWFVEILDSTKLKTVFEFETPQYVSIGEEPDQLEITFYPERSGSLLQTVEGELILPSGFQMVIDLPKQEDRDAEPFYKLPIPASTATFTIIYPLMIIFNVSMQEMAGSINSLAITAHIPMIDIRPALNSENVFN